MATKRRMDDFFRDITSFSRDKGFPSRVQFLFADLVDTRNANWESARQMAPQAKKISEIHEDAKREEEAKMAQMNNPGRDMRGGNVGNRRSFQTNFQPPQQQNMNKMTMHMHNRPSNQIQTTNRLDSQAKRFSTSRPGTFKPVNVELKPGGGGGGGLMKFGGLRSLVMISAQILDSAGSPCPFLFPSETPTHRLCTPQSNDLVLISSVASKRCLP